jgi:T-complex protein 1 subunit delta
MDKMIRSGKGETIITNDGSTMLKSMSVLHPTAKMLVNLSNAQDVEAGDGTTSVVVICGSLLGAADRLLSKGIHPSVISESFQRAAAAAVEVLHDMSQPISLTDTASLLQAANTSLSSKIVSQYSNLLGPMAVNAVTKTIDLKTADNVDLKNIRIIKKVGGTIEDSELVEGLVLTQPVIKSAGGPVRMEKAKIGLIQFQLSPPKPDVRIAPPIYSICSPLTMSCADGEHHLGKRLPADGQDRQGRADVPPQHGQEDQEGQVQRAVHPEIDPPRCGQRLVAALPPAAGHIGSQGH